MVYAIHLVHMCTNACIHLCASLITTALLLWCWCMMLCGGSGGGCWVVVVETTTQEMRKHAPNQITNSNECLCNRATDAFDGGGEAEEE